MIELPPALRPWRAALELFPRELALAVGGLCQRLALAFGPLRARATAGRDDPDGVDGLDRRGSFERLLASEWLLADEVPDEFLRRAAMGELAFHRLAFRSPATARRSLALLDAGPSQLGTPRVAQLAILVVLAQRAEAAGVDFAWGLLQDRDRRLVAGLGRATVARLLGARTPVAPSDDDLAAWRRTIAERSDGDAGARIGDLWLVGAPSLAELRAARELSHAAVEDVLDEARRQVTVTLRRPGGGATSRLALDLPTVAECVRLLRDPFGAAPPPPRRLAPGHAVDPDSELQVNADGTRVIVRLANGGVMAHPVPDSPRSTVGKPAIHPPTPGARILGVGFEAGHLWVMELRHDTLWLVRRGRRGGLIAETRLICDGELLFALPSEDGPQCPIWRLEGSSGIAVTVIRDARGALWAATREDGTRDAAVFHRIADEVLAVGVAPSRLRYVRRTGSAGAVEESLPPRTDPARPLSDREVIEARYAPWTNALALRTGSSWRVQRPTRGEVVLVPRGGATVVGLDLVDESAEPQLVLIDSDRRRMLLQNLGGTREIPVDGTIRHALGGVAKGRVAWVTAAGELVVYSHLRGVVLLRLSAHGVRA